MNMRSGVVDSAMVSIFLLYGGHIQSYDCFSPLSRWILNRVVFAFNLCFDVTKFENRYFRATQLGDLCKYFDSSRWKLVISDRPKQS